MEERLHKILAHAGFGSRRKCEEYIQEGLVSVDGKVVKEMGLKLDPSQHNIECNGESLVKEKPVYYIVNKPKGYVCTVSDEKNRHKVTDLIPDSKVRLYPVGRLDKDSEGLVLLTNDGHLTNIITHPKYHIKKTYIVTVTDEVTDETISKLLKGFHLSDGKVKMDKIKIIKKSKKYTELEVIISQGIKRQIRRMLAKFGHKVQRLFRSKIAHLSVDGIKVGGYKRLHRSIIKPILRKANEN